MPRRSGFLKVWAKPLVRGSAPVMAGGRTGGAAPFGILEFDGAAEPRLTSGGEAGVEGVKFQDRHRAFN